MPFIPLIYLTRAPLGWIYNAPRWGANISPLLSPKLLGLFLKFKKCLIALPKLSSELNFIDLGSPMTSQVRSK